MHPDPVPTSTTRGGVDEGGGWEGDGKRARRNFRTRVTSSSVSGRGMSARRSHVSVSERKSHSPSTYWIGSPFARRAMPRRMAST